MSEKTVEVTSGNFQFQVLGSPMPVLVDFGAEWCPPCKRLDPVVDELASEYVGKLVVGKMDADANQDVVIHYGVMGLPTLILFKDGKPVERIIGYRPKEKILDQLKPHLS